MSTSLMLAFFLVVVVAAAAAVVIIFASRARKAGPEGAIDRFLAQLERRQSEAASAVHRVVTAHKEVRDRVAAYEEEARRWGQQAREMLLAGDEISTRDRLERQVRAEHAAEALRADFQALEEAKIRADAQYEALKQLLESASTRYTALAARQAAVGPQEGYADLAAEERKADEAYARLQEGVAEAEARAAATAEVAAAGRVYEDPSEIDRRLAGLRRPEGA